MKKLEIHHVLDGKTVVTSLSNVSDKEAEGALERFARLRANDGTFNGPNFAIPARLVELVRVVDQ